MPSANLLLPWRWKHAVYAVLDAKFASARDALHGVLEDIGTRLETRHAGLEARLAEQCAELRTQSRERDCELAELRSELFGLRQALLDPSDGASFHRMRSAAAELRQGMAALRNEIAAQLDFSLHDMASQMAEQRILLERVGAELRAELGEIRNTLAALSRESAGAVRRDAEQQARIEKVGSESANLLMHLDTSIRSRLNGLDQSGFEAASCLKHLQTSLESRLNEFRNVMLPEIVGQIHEAAALQMRAAADRADRSAWRAHPEERYAPARPDLFDACLARAAQNFPKVYEAWRERLDATRAACAETKLGNAAHAGDRYSGMFRSLVEMHAAGRVLDIGCGMFGRPCYLAGYPADLVSGLDPLPAVAPTDFELVRGLSEYLPWPDGAFSTVISATSLDHCLSLEASLSEMLRVLRPGGTALLWIGSNPGAPKFEPDGPGFAPADRFHLFRFDKAWFEPMLEERFDLVDRLELQAQGYSHVFYALRPRAPAAAPAVRLRQPADELV